MGWTRRIDRAFDHRLVDLFGHSAISDAKGFAMVFIANPAGQEGRQELLTEDPEGVSKDLSRKRTTRGKNGNTPGGHFRGRPADAEQVHVPLNERKFSQREENMIVMSSVKSSAKAWNTTAARLAVVNLMAAAVAWSWLDTGTCATAARRGIRQAGKNLPQTGRRELHCEPRAGELRGGSFHRLLPTRSVGSAARTDGWISARARGRPYSTTTHREAMRLLKSAADPVPGRAWSRSPSRIASRKNGNSRPRASAMTAYGISPADV